MKQFDLEVSFVLTTSINSAYVLGYSGTVMVPLGWIGGVVGLLLATAISLYANSLIANLHEFGGKRHIRYRDLAGFIYALKAVYVLFRDDSVMKLPHFIAIAGVVCAIFAVGIPYLSALGIWLGVSTILSMIYIVVAIVLSFKDGVNKPSRDYTIQGSSVDKIFTITGAAANLVFAFNSGMLPEIQATVKQPVVKNMMKALYLQFTAGALPLYAVTFIGYWAYGSSTSTYLMNSVTGPLWAKALANISAFLQSVISLHIFASPTYEFMDTKYGTKGGSPLALKNLLFRTATRGSYIAVSTLLSALLPFLGDFMSLTGAISTFPLTFILANHMYLVAMDSELSSVQKLWHWLNVCFFGLMSLASAIAAVRLISVDSKNFHGRQGERVRLYVRGTVLGYKRSKSNQYPNTSLIQIEGVNTTEEVNWYKGKRMAYIYKAKTKKNGSHYRCIWGKVTRPHGNSGVVRAKFTSNLPPKSMGARVRVFIQSGTPLSPPANRIHKKARFFTPISDLLFFFIALFFITQILHSPFVPWEDQILEGPQLKERMSSFTGTQQKCKACEKTVYPVELLSADGVSYHKSCFKCSHCKSRLQLSRYSSMEGVLYCKPHYEQLFKESGSFTKNFQSPVKPAAEKSSPELTRTPSRVAGMFSGTQEKCATCSKTVYPIEKVTVESQTYHKSCFKCSHGGCPISPSNYAALEGILYCKHHFAQLFKEKGSYNHLIKSASIKRSAAAAVAAGTPAAAVPES
ncbi:hypothetical protein HID58_082321 [Brassica napus]|uniref:LIM zinc-binding domain-containing protein n=2 Tax=Brassica napus TaxID=3708 RepID=A0ABQ7YDB6_BRANA|nr:hypothetical protein HID58_082321 [Brassica napus]